MLGAPGSGIIVTLHVVLRKPLPPKAAGARRGSRLPVPAPHTLTRGTRRPPLCCSIQAAARAEQGVLRHQLRAAAPPVRQAAAALPPGTPPSGRCRPVHLGSPDRMPLAPLLSTLTNSPADPPAVQHMNEHRRDTTLPAGRRRLSTCPPQLPRAPGVDTCNWIDAWQRDEEERVGKGTKQAELFNAACYTPVSCGHTRE